MELKLTSVIDILKQEINPNRPTVDGRKALSGYATGIQHCIDLLTKISEVRDREDGRTYFEFKEGEDNLVLLIPLERQEFFRSCIDIMFEGDKNSKDIGKYLSLNGILSNEYPYSAPNA